MCTTAIHLFTDFSLCLLCSKVGTGIREGNNSTVTLVLSSKGTQYVVVAPSRIIYSTFHFDFVPHIHTPRITVSTEQTT